MQEMQVQSLGWEDLLEKEMATHSNILAWEIPWTEEPGRLQCMGLQDVRCDLATKQQQQLRKHLKLPMMTVAAIYVSSAFVALPFLFIISVIIPFAWSAFEGT